jgi:hypothetical protein
MVIGGDFYTNFSNGIPTKIGSYVITYTATDSSGNQVVVTRHINVVDTHAPDVTLLGDMAVNICRWSNYQDAGITYSDNYWTGSDITIDTLGTFMTSKTDKPGIYTLYYVVTDKSGNKTTTEPRTINVKKETDFFCTSGINNASDVEKAIAIYPNPSSGLFTVTTNLPSVKEAKVIVTDMLGQQISVVNSQPMGKGQFTLDLRTQSAGIYLVNIYTGNEVIVKRIVVSK